MQTCALGDFDKLQQLVKGMYSLFLPAWLASYPPSHLLVLNFDDYRSAALLACHLCVYGFIAGACACRAVCATPYVRMDVQLAWPLQHVASATPPCPTCCDQS